MRLIKTGDKVGASEATLLNMLNISPFTYGLQIEMGTSPLLSVLSCALTNFHVYDETSIFIVSCHVLWFDINHLFLRDLNYYIIAFSRYFLSF